MGADFCAPKSGLRSQKGSVFSPDSMQFFFSGADIETYLNQIFDELRLSNHKQTYSPPLLSPPLSPLPPSPLQFGNESIQTSLSWAKERKDDSRTSDQYLSDEDTDSKADGNFIHSNILPLEVHDSIGPENCFVEDSRKNYKDSNLNEHGKSMDPSLAEVGCLELRNECTKQWQFMAESQNVSESTSVKNKINHDNNQTSEKQEMQDQSNVVVDQAFHLNDKEIIHSAKISSLENMESFQNIDKDNHVRSNNNQTDTGLVRNSTGNGINITYLISSASRKEKSECFCNNQGKKPSKNTGIAKVSENILVTESISKLSCQNPHISITEMNSQALVQKGEMEGKNVSWLPTVKGNNEGFPNIENQLPNENCKIQNWEKACLMTRENEGNNSKRNSIHIPGSKEEIKTTGDGKRSESSSKICKLLYDKNSNELQRKGNNQTQPSNPDSIKKDSGVTGKINIKGECSNKNDGNSIDLDEENNRRNDLADKLTDKMDGTAETEIETTGQKEDYCSKNTENDLTLQSSECYSQTSGAFTKNVKELNIEIAESENKLNAKGEMCTISSEKNENNSNAHILVSAADNFETRDHDNQVKSKKDSNSGESRVQLNLDQPPEKDSQEQENTKEKNLDEKTSLPCVSIDKEDQINKSLDSDQSVSDSLLIISPEMFSKSKLKLTKRYFPESKKVEVNKLESFFSPKQDSSYEINSNEIQFRAGVSRVGKEEKLQNLLTASKNGKNMKAGNFDTTETGVNKPLAKTGHMLVVPKANMKNSSTLRQVDVQKIVQNKLSKSKLKQQFSPGVPFSDSGSSGRCCVEMNNITMKKEDSLDENDSEVAFLNMVSKKVNTLKHSENKKNEIFATLEPTQKTVSFVSHISNMYKKPNTSRRISRAKIINRRHTIAVGNPTNSVRSPAKRAARTKSFSPSIFLSPSPPLSPIPPSPHRSALTPIISPLPTTPLPESVSPLPPSPKITSPPMIRGMALCHSENLSIHVPKPVVPNERLKAVKAITFQKKLADLPIIMSPELQSNRSSSSVGDNFKDLKNVAHAKSLSRANSLKRNADCSAISHQPKPKSTKKISFLEPPHKVNILKEDLEREPLTTGLNGERLQTENDLINSNTNKKPESQMSILDSRKVEFQNSISSKIPLEDRHDIKMKNLRFINDNSENIPRDFSDSVIEQKRSIRHKHKSETSSYSALENEASSAVASLVENNINLSSQAHCDNKEEYKLVDTSNKEVSEILDRDSQNPIKYTNHSKTLNPASLLAEAKPGIIKTKSGTGIDCKGSALYAHNYTEENIHDEISADKVSYTNLQKQPTQQIIDGSENNEKKGTTSCVERNDNRDIPFNEVIQNTEDPSLSLREKNQVEKGQIDNPIDKPRNDSAEILNNPKAKHTQGKFPLERTNNDINKQNNAKQIKSKDPDMKSAATGLGRKKESPSNKIMNKKLYKNTKFIVKKLFKVSSSNRILNKKKILTSILSKENNIDISAICNAIIELVQRCSEVPDILKSIEQNCKPNGASQGKLNCKCITQAANGLPSTESSLHNNFFSSPCQNCQKLRGTTLNSRTNCVFNTCGNLLYHPVLTGLEHDLLIITRKLFADQRFRRKLQTILLKRIKELLKSYEKLITVERLALWYVSFLFFFYNKIYFFEGFAII